MSGDDGAAGHIIRSTRFRREREAEWTRLETLLARVERSGPRALDFDEARELGQLYRQALNALSVAREISLDRGLLDYLESLACRAYLAVYAPQETLSGALWRFLSAGAPQAIRRSGAALALAAAAMALGVWAAYGLFLEDPAWFSSFVPPGLAGGRGPESTRAALEAGLYDRLDDLSALGAFATMLFSHNAQVALFAFALGALACAPSLALAFYNGLILGAFLALYADRGLAVDLIAWLSVHGVTELAAIIIAVAGGLRLGFAVLYPGRVARGDALRREGRDAVKLAVIAAIMLVAAALLEGFARQLITDLQARLWLGWGVGALWLVYFLLAGRGTDRDGGARSDQEPAS